MSLTQGRPLPYFSSAATAEAAVKIAAPSKLEMRMVIVMECGECGSVESSLR